MNDEELNALCARLDAIADALAPAQGPVNDARAGLREAAAMIEAQARELAELRIALAEVQP